MRIPNYDNDKDKPKDRHYYDFIGEDYILLISGKSNCGKTNTLIHIIRKPLVYYDKIYIYTPNGHQSKLQDLSKLMRAIDKKIKYKHPVLEILAEDEIKATNEYPNYSRIIVVFDDLINAPDVTQKKIANHFTDGRHHNISPIYLSQSYYDTPKKIRINCSHMILYPSTDKRDCKAIADDNKVNIELCDYLNKYEFLFIDKVNKTVKKNFDLTI